MLNIYRASAGAGKTHHLTGEYIKLLFCRDLMPESAEHETQFNEILAVTFTNKSTAEMKARIVKELSILGENPQNSDYYKELHKDSVVKSWTDKQISDKAKKLLNDILNNYSDFSVSTIDSFFQKIVRGFAREMNVQGNYELELNYNRILDLAVSNFMEKLDRPHQKKLFDWMMKFSEKKIEEGAGWQLEKDLQNLVKSTLTTEDFRKRKDVIQKITDDKDLLSDYIKMLQEIVFDTKRQLKELGTTGVKVLGEAGFMTTDFKRGKYSKMRILEYWAGGIIKEPDDEHEAWANNAEEWYAKPKRKTDTVRRLPKAQTEVVMQLLQKAMQLKAEGIFVRYNTTRMILDNIYQLGILADIDKEVNEVCNYEGTMLLSSTTEMLNKLINKDDAPFIYEKTGTHIHHFMIDEFQDTSYMQWNNFKPLIENSLADGRENLIVGDVKQSIYRWRGGDWGLLHSGLKNFAEGQSREDTSTLDTNYRSQSEIIKFNNNFFKYVSLQLSEIFEDEDIKSIFSDVEQKVPTKKQEDSPGSVEVRFIDIPKGADFEELAMENIPDAVIQLEDAKFKAKDIAILCRTKKLCKKAADALLKYKNEHPEDKIHTFDIISSEALLLNSRQVIQTILSILRFIQNPESKILKAIAAYNYLQQQESLSPDTTPKWGGEQDAREPLSLSPFGGEVGREAELFLQFSNRPLYDMVEGVISMLPNVNKDIAYVQAFRDCVLEFVNTKKSDVAAFLEWWEIYGEDRYINTPEGQDAIRIMTIHKSKGLGMPAVILPFVEGSTDIDNKGGEVIWCQPDKAPFNDIDIFLPVKRSKALMNTIFADDYKKERLRAVIDNINTMYVAFTRAKEAMVIFTPNTSDTAKADSQECLLRGYVGEDEYVKIYGKIGRKKNYDEENNEVVTISQNDEEYSTLRKLPHLSLKHDRLIKDIEAVERGNCLHKALSAIIDYDNIDKPIDNLYLSGGLSVEYFSCEEMKSEIHRLLSYDDVRQWFRPGLRIFNERTILGLSEANGQVKTLHRPDRVIISPAVRENDGYCATVIDYKTGEHRKSYFRQVGEYMYFLRQMGFKYVKGYLWYTNPHNIVEVPLVE